MRAAAIFFLSALFLSVLMSSPARAGIAWPEAGLEVASGAGSQDLPLVIPDEMGGSIIIWLDDSPGAIVLYAQRYDRDGQALWSGGGVPLSTNLPVADQLYPTAVPDSYGGCLVFWHDERGANSQIYGQHLTYLGTRGWGDEAKQMDPSPADQTGPRAVSDGAGGAVVLWRDWRNDSGSGDIDLYAVRVDTSGLMVYSGTRALVSIATTAEGYPRVAGGLWLAWEDYRGTDSAVYVQRVNSSGSTMLTSGGARLSGSSLVASVPAMAPDGKGGVHVTYTTSDTVNIGLHYHHLMPGVAWLDDTDQPIYTGAGFSWDSPAAIVPDGRNGCFVAWPDSRTGTGRMYLQQLNYRGETGFAAGGIALTNVDQYQSYPSMAPTGTGRMVCAWRDNRNSGSGNELDVYAQSLVLPVAGMGALSLLLE